MSGGKGANLSDNDRKILKILLTPNGRISSKTLSKKFGIPTTTIQRRRRRLEKEFLIQSYFLDLERFGWHKVDFLIATESSKTDMLGKALLKRDEVTMWARASGSTL